VRTRTAQTSTTPYRCLVWGGYSGPPCVCSTHLDILVTSPVILYAPRFTAANIVAAATRWRQQSARHHTIRLPARRCIPPSPIDARHIAAGARLVAIACVWIPPSRHQVRQQRAFSYCSTPLPLWTEAFIRTVLSTATTPSAMPCYNPTAHSLACLLSQHILPPHSFLARVYRSRQSQFKTHLLPHKTYALLKDGTQPPWYGHRTHGGKTPATRFILFAHGRAAHHTRGICPHACTPS